MVDQISVFLENKPGRMTHFAQTLAGAGINLITLTVADTTQFGILRCLVDRPDDAVTALRTAGFTVNKTPVIACEVPDHPGGLAAVMEAISAAGVSIEYLYSFVRHTGDCALVVFQVNDLLAAKQAMETSGYRTVDQDKIGVF